MSVADRPDFIDKVHDAPQSANSHIENKVKLSTRPHCCGFQPLAWFHLTATENCGLGLSSNLVASVCFAEPKLMSRMVQLRSFTQDGFFATSSYLVCQQSKLHDGVVMTGQWYWCVAC